MYTVEVHHHDKNWRNGDLEDKLELIKCRNFKTRRDAKTFIEGEVFGKKNVERHYNSKETTNYVIWFTGKTWQHENSGVQMQEYWQYTLKKEN